MVTTDDHLDCNYKANRNGFSHYFRPWAKKRGLKLGAHATLIRANSTENINMRTLRKMRKAVS